MLHSAEAARKEVEELPEARSRSQCRFLEVRAALNSDGNGDDYEDSTALVWALESKET